MSCAAGIRPAPSAEPKRQAHSETVRNWPPPARGSLIPPYRPACAILLESQIPTNIVPFSRDPANALSTRGAESSMSKISASPETTNKKEFSRERNCLARWRQVALPEKLEYWYLQSFQTVAIALVPKWDQLPIFGANRCHQPLVAREFALNNAKLREFLEIRSLNHRSSDLTTFSNTFT